MQAAACCVCPGHITTARSRHQASPQMRAGAHCTGLCGQSINILSLLTASHGCFARKYTDIPPDHPLSPPPSGPPDQYGVMRQGAKIPKNLVLFRTIHGVYECAFLFLGEGSGEGVGQITRPPPLPRHRNWCGIVGFGMGDIPIAS